MCDEINNFWFSSMKQVKILINWLKFTYLLSTIFITLVLSSFDKKSLYITLIIMNKCIINWHKIFHTPNKQIRTPSNVIVILLSLQVGRLRPPNHNLVALQSHTHPLTHTHQTHLPSQIKSHSHSHTPTELKQTFTTKTNNSPWSNSHRPIFSSKKVEIARVLHCLS